MTNSAERPLRVGLVSLGCAKNLVDAEIMLGSLLKEGIEITNQPAQADVVIVNTCSFIDSAQQESIDAILASAEERDKANPAQGLIVSGCMPQRFRDDLPKLLPEVDAFMGIDQVAQVPAIVREAMQRRREKLEKRPAAQSQVSRRAEVQRGSPQSAQNAAAPPIMDVHVRPTYVPDFATPRFRLTPSHFAYVKIAEGCNHPCSFCTIPRMRGSHRSRLQSDVVREAAELVGQGVKELNLISQDSTYYGLDLRENASRAISSPEKFSAAAGSLAAGSATLCTLLRELQAIPGRFWIRLLYTHPAHWTDELIATIAQCPKVARYVDMPLQHIDEGMLERMRRETSRQYIIDLIARIRAGIPGIALRTTFIVGFPGETERSFENLLEFTAETKFERLGVFTYSQQEGTRASRMEGQISEKVKKQRQKAVMLQQREIAREISASFVGRELDVLTEGRASEENSKFQTPNSRKIPNSKLQGGSRPAPNSSSTINSSTGGTRSWEHGLIRSAGASAAVGEASADESFLIARGEADAPDIDGRVYVRGDAPQGQFARVKIIGHTDYDLIAQMV